MHDVERDPALGPVSTGEKAVATALKHSWQERQLPTPAGIQQALGTRTAPSGKRVDRARELPYPLRGSFCHIAPLLPPVSWRSPLLRLRPLTGAFTYHTV